MTPRSNRQARPRQPSPGIRFLRRPAAARYSPAASRSEDSELLPAQVSTQEQPTWITRKSSLSERSCCGSRRPTTCASTRRSSSAPATAAAKPTWPSRWPTTVCGANSSPACRPTALPTPVWTICAVTGWRPPTYCAADSGWASTTWRRLRRCARRRWSTTGPARRSTRCSRGRSTGRRSLPMPPGSTGRGSRPP